MQARMEKLKSDPKYQAHKRLRDSGREEKTARFYVAINGGFKQLREAMDKTDFLLATLKFAKIHPTSSSGMGFRWGQYEESLELQAKYSPMIQDFIDSYISNGVKYEWVLDRIQNKYINPVMTFGALRTKPAKMYKYTKITPKVVTGYEIHGLSRPANGIKFLNLLWLLTNYDDSTMRWMKNLIIREASKYWEPITSPYYHGAKAYIDAYNHCIYQYDRPNSEALIGDLYKSFTTTASGFPRHCTGGPFTSVETLRTTQEELTIWKDHYGWDSKYVNGLGDNLATDQPIPDEVDGITFEKSGTYLGHDLSLRCPTGWKGSRDRADLSQSLPKKLPHVYRKDDSIRFRDFVNISVAYSSDRDGYRINSVPWISIIRKAAAKKVIFSHREEWAPDLVAKVLAIDRTLKNRAVSWARQLYFRLR
jgi:hypothetical protein